MRTGWTTSHTATSGWPEGRTSTGPPAPITPLTTSQQRQTIQVRVSFTDDRNNAETLTSEATGAVAAAPNRTATGLPTISGTAQVGETLTASTSDIADQDGLDNATFSYQWLADDSAITDATGSTYTLVPADQGKSIKVRVSFTDDADNEETLTSAATAAVAASPNSPATGAPTISGTAQLGETLDGFHLGHRGRGWVGQCHLQLSVAGGRLGHY